MPSKNASPWRWCFSTLGCAELDLDGVLALAAKHAVPCVELRALGGSLELPAYFARTCGTPRELARRVAVAAAGARVVALDTSFRLVGGTVDERVAFLDFLPWAEALGGMALRVFDGGKILDARALDEARETMRWWDEMRAHAGWKSTVVIETHDSAITTSAIQQVFARAPESVGLLWDAHHTWRRGGEDPLATWRAVRGWVRHVHLKDSVSRPSERHPFTYVHLGTGEFPLQPLLATMCADGYSGVVSLEWERKWHPYLAPLEKELDAARAFGAW